MELIVVSSSNQFVGSVAAGATVYQTSTYPGGAIGYAAVYGADLLCDPHNLESTGSFVSTTTSAGAGTDYWQVC